MIKVGNKTIGIDEPCFFIAEAGVNHNGDMKLAKKLIDEAKNAGADAVKFQTFKTELIVTESAKTADYARRKTGTESQKELLKKLELSKEDHIELQKYANKRGIMFFSTPHSDEWSVDLLNELKVPLFKIGSGDLDNLPFLKYVARAKKPMIISTGMATLDEIKEAVQTIRGELNEQIVVLHCTTSYPCDIKDSNLRMMNTIREECSVLVGYSDHTTDVITPSIAHALGAVVVEKHFTLDRNLPGPDHQASAEPSELKEAISLLRKTELLLGSPMKELTEAELKIREIARKSIVARTDIQKGQDITKDMLAIKRPGTGLRPKMLGSVVGKKATRAIKKDEMLQKTDFQ
ncbi:N-acetylneuraminate synthase [Candidatus Woesearchaeota archaeon]|nr:N-acetylneuraminate synthase [Candidatus Woesearchaeota archaeon]